MIKHGGFTFHGLPILQQHVLGENANLAVFNLYFIIRTLQLLESRVRSTHEHNGSCYSPVWFHLNEHLFLCFVPLPPPQLWPRTKLLHCQRNCHQRGGGEGKLSKEDHCSSPWQFPPVLRPLVLPLTSYERFQLPIVIHRTKLLHRKVCKLCPILSSMMRSPHPAIMKLQTS